MINQTTAPMPIVEAAKPRFLQGDTEERPRPEPRASRINESADRTKAPAMTAAHDTPDEYASFAGRSRSAVWRFVKAFSIVPLIRAARRAGSRSASTDFGYPGCSSALPPGLWETQLPIEWLPKGYRRVNYLVSHLYHQRCYLAGGADELPLTETPNVEGEVTDDPVFPAALVPPALVPIDVLEVVAGPAPAPPAACAYATGELARAMSAALLSRHTTCFFKPMVFSDHQHCVPGSRNAVPHCGESPRANERTSKSAGETS